MKKSFVILSICLILSFSINTTIAIAQPTISTASEGFYNIQDLKLLPDVMYNVSNASGADVYMIIFDDKQIIQQSIRFEPNSIKYVLKPMKYNYRIVIIGKQGKLVFTSS
ncbi:hypothetical protein [Clostridium sp. C2-6-12]|uniref:hypothetical protein n=1 Tax=Clostridium sp. C2-6-12 TaxID=2698832 RepID=UPI00136C0257|nr:hypothetical protein [Clostridium sp. C2-6-12]